MSFTKHANRKKGKTEESWRRTFMRQDEDDPDWFLNPDLDGQEEDASGHELTWSWRRNRNWEQEVNKWESVGVITNTDHDPKRMSLRCNDGRYLDTDDHRD